MKSFRSLSLVGILSLGFLGSSAYGLETNEKGFPVPDKNNAKPDVASLGNIVLKLYSLPNGNRLEEYVVNNKTGLYIMVIGSNKRESYVIEDRNCDNVFETKYSLEEFENSDTPIPECYFK